MVHLQTTTQSKRKYIEEWDSYINGLGSLTWTQDRELSKEVVKKQVELKELVRKIAETKKFRWEKV
jgi:hypothetical protein